MVKYRGKIDGKERGEYRSHELGAWFSVNDFERIWGSDPVHASPAKDMDVYLSRAGWRVGRQPDWSKESVNGLSVYHCGGATVTVRYRFKSGSVKRFAAGNMSVTLVSNDPLDDVLDRLKREFPYLKEGASVDDLPDPDSCVD